VGEGRGVGGGRLKVIGIIGLCGLCEVGMLFDLFDISLFISYHLFI